jgi:apolipoprotein D and lipocalin family protein
MGSIGSKQTVANLDPLRYQGLWWEVAKIPFIPEEGCVSASAVYSYDFNDNSFSVVNTCYYSNEKSVIIKGKAIVPCKEYPGRLYVSFGGTYPTLYDIKKGNYWIIYTDYEKFSVVTNPEETLMWVLSRSNLVSKYDVECLLMKVTSMGYNTSCLIINKNLVY